MRSKKASYISQMFITSSKYSYVLLRTKKKRQPINTLVSNDWFVSNHYRPVIPKTNFLRYTQNFLCNLAFEWWHKFWLHILFTATCKFGKDRDAPNILILTTESKRVCYSSSHNYEKMNGHVSYYLSILPKSNFCRAIATR